MYTGELARIRAPRQEMQHIERCPVVAMMDRGPVAASLTGVASRAAVFSKSCANNPIGYRIRQVRARSVPWPLGAKHLAYLGQVVLSKAVVDAVDRTELYEFKGGICDVKKPTSPTPRTCRIRGAPSNTFVRTYQPHIMVTVRQKAIKMARCLSGVIKM